MRLHELGQPPSRDMGVDLRRGDVGMAQHLLQTAEIGTVIQEMRRESMAQHMGRNPLRRNVRLQGKFLEQLPKALPREMPFLAARREKMRRVLGTLRQKSFAVLQIGIQRGAGRRV